MVFQGLLLVKLGLAKPTRRFILKFKEGLIVLALDAKTGKTAHACLNFQIHYKRGQVLQIIAAHIYYDFCN